MPAQAPERVGDVRKPRDRDRLQVIPPITLGKDFHFRRRRVSCQFRRRENRAVATEIGGTIMATHNGGSVTGVNRSPIPRASAGSPRRKKGTSAPSATPIRMSSARGRFAPQSRLSARSTLAASELPPPIPLPSGTRFVSAISTPNALPVSLLEGRRGANREIVLRRNARQVRRAHDHFVVAAVSVILSPASMATSSVSRR